MATDLDARRARAVLTRLAAVDVDVLQVGGWERRGADWTREPLFVFDHHDASSIKSGEWGSLGVIVAGRDGIPAPLSQWQVARCLDGVPKVALAACGRANHAGVGGPLTRGALRIPTNDANAWAWGVEKANNGLGEVATAAADYATNALFRCLLEVMP